MAAPTPARRSAARAGSVSRWCSARRSRRPSPSPPGSSIADQLAAGPKTAAELAAATGLHAGHLYRVLRALAGLGVFAGDDDGRFSLTPMGNLLRSDVPGSARAIATYVCDPWSWKPWGDLRGARQDRRDRRSTASSARACSTTSPSTPTRPRRSTRG